MMSLENLRKVLKDKGLHSNLESNLDSKMRTVRSTRMNNQWDSQFDSKMTTVKSAKTNNLWDILEIPDIYKVSLLNHLVSNNLEDITLIKETKTSHNNKFHNNFPLLSMTI